MRRWILAIVSVVAAVGQVAVPSGFAQVDQQQVLVPIAFGAEDSLQGAEGTLWVGEMWVANESGVAVQHLQEQHCLLGCPDPQLPAKSRRRIAMQTGAAADAGALGYVPREIASELSFSARVLEITRQAQPTGFSLPVVRDDEYFHSPVTLLGIATGTAVRSSLRIYDPTAQARRYFNVTVITEAGVEVASMQLATAGPSVPAVQPYQPGYASIHDLESKLGTATDGQRIHIRVVPLDGKPYWTFASVTHNETQHVLVVTAD
jgi:hypothetical protein